MRKILHTDDPPHRLALGIAIGVFVAFTPTIGVQMLLVVFLAWLFRANKAVGVPLVWISNPATVVPIFYWCYHVGQSIWSQPTINQLWWNELAAPPGGWKGVAFYWTKVLEIAEPLWLGSLIVGLAMAIPSYLTVYYGIRTYRLRRWGKLVPPASDAVWHEAVSIRTQNAAVESDKQVHADMDIMETVS